MIHCTSSGCNPTCQRLHPHVLEAAPLCARGYDPMHPGCNPTCPGARLLHQLLRRVSAALGGHPAADGHGATGAGVLGRGGRELLCAMGRDRRGAHGAGVLKVEACKLEGRPHGRRHDARRCLGNACNCRSSFIEHPLSNCNSIEHCAHSRGHRAARLGSAYLSTHRRLQRQSRTLYTGYLTHCKHNSYFIFWHNGTTITS